MILIFYGLAGVLLGWAYGAWALRRGRRPSVHVAYLWSAVAAVALTVGMVVAIDGPRMLEPGYQFFDGRDGVEMFVLWNALASIAVYVPVVVWVAIYQRKWRRRFGIVAAPAGS